MSSSSRRERRTSADANTPTKPKASGQRRPFADGEKSTLPLKPITRPPARAKSNARQNLATALVEKFGHDPASAAAIARAVVDPTRVRVQLNAPIAERVPGGTLQMVHAPIWPVAASPSPINPRGSGAKVYPSAAQADRRLAVPRRPLVSAASDEHGAPVLTLEVDDADHLAGSLQDSINVLMSTAEKLLADIPEQGVMRPVTVVAMRVSHKDGSGSITFPTTPDGSSRTAITWKHWGLDDAGAVYEVVDDRLLGKRVANVEKLAQKDATLLTEEDRILLRLATIPAVIIVGFEPDLGSTVTFAEAVESWVSMIHIDPPRPWGTSADLDTKATAIVDSFRRQMNWAPTYIDYLAGNLTPQEAKAAGYACSPDGRAVEIMASLGDDNRKKILNDGLRRLGARKPWRQERLEPLVELMLRSLRGVVAPGEITVARTILLNLREMAAWNRPGWKPSGMAVDELYKKAEAERAAAEAVTEEYEETPVAGNLSAELGFMAAFWLARYGALRRQTRVGEGGDDREPEHLLRLLMSTEYGLRVLKKVVEDGRAGRQPIAIGIDGTEVTDATGEKVPVTTAWLKTAFPAGTTTAPATTAPDFTQVVTKVRHQVDALEAAVKELMTLRGGAGERLATTLGIKPSAVDVMTKKTNWAAGQLGLCAARWEERHTDDEDEDGEGE